MGYEVQLKFPKNFEIDKEFKPERTNGVLGFGNISDYENEILCYTLMGNEDDNLNNTIFQLRLNVITLVSKLEERCKRTICNDIEKDGIWWVRGYNYHSNYSDYDIEEETDRAVRELSILKTVIKTPDFFDDEEKFFEKKREITDIFDRLDEIVTDVIYHKFLEHYREEYEDKGDEDEENVVYDDIYVGPQTLLENNENLNGDNVTQTQG